mmetsp:Transcript_50/g.107  ORF Transcript_50/g.107 Transcript_50/m.107 type:complete len:253 (+) Transcript_50:445-1203(+)
MARLTNQDLTNKIKMANKFEARVVNEEIDGFDLFGETFDFYDDEDFLEECDFSLLPNLDRAGTQSLDSEKVVTLGDALSRCEPNLRYSIPVIRTILVEESTECGSCASVEQKECKSTNAQMTKLIRDEEEEIFLSKPLSPLPSFDGSSSTESAAENFLPILTNTAAEAPSSPSKTVHICTHETDDSLNCHLCSIDRKTIYRREKIKRWREKKKRRNKNVKVYHGRSAVACARPRVGGRFVREQTEFISVTTF